MKRFCHQKEHSWLKQTASVALFAAVFLLFLLGLDGIDRKTSAQRAESLRLSISRGIASCYAMEGAYPESLAYLKEHYGIRYDSDEFFVDYQVLGENIFPDVTIIEK